MWFGCRVQGAGCGVSSLEVERSAPGSASAPPATRRLRLEFICGLSMVYLWFIYRLFMVYWGFIRGVLRFIEGWFGV